MEYFKYFNEFIKNFLMGGITIGIYSLVIKYLSAGFAGHASGALPLVYTYVLIKTYQLFGYEETQRVSMIGFIAGFFWLAYALFIVIMLKYQQGIIFTICMAIIFFFVINYIYYKLRYAKNIKYSKYSKLKKK
tara:strand:- start:26 stop:424 length:399 start_codon:yes stop_codon:yes gene_type:complete